MISILWELSRLFSSVEGLLCTVKNVYHTAVRVMKEISTDQVAQSKRNLFCHHSGRPESEIKCWQDLFFLDALRKNPFLPLSSFLVVSNNPWYSLACRNVFPFYTFVFASSLCLLPFSLYKDSVIGFRIHSNPRQSHFEVLTLLISAQTLVFNKYILRFQVDVKFWGYYAIHYYCGWEFHKGQLGSVGW